MAIDTSQKRRRSMNTVLHAVAAPLNPFPYDGALKVDRAHVAGFFQAGATRAVDPAILYAVEVYASFDPRFYGKNESPSDDAIGLRDGVFRWITGRPGFDGTQTNVFWEEYLGEEHVLNTEQWFEGFLIDDGLSNPSRRIDIKDSGDYATLNGFDFSVRNDNFFWDLVEQRKIYIANCSVQVFVVINRTFYSLWQGIVSATSYTETEFKFDCESNFKAVHRQFPPEIVTAAAFPGVHEKSIGQAIPVCLGDVSYAKGLNVSGPVEPLTMVIRSGHEFTVCAAVSYEKEMLNLRTDGCSFGENGLIGYYLRVIKGEGDDYYPIISNEATKDGYTKVQADNVFSEWEKAFCYPSNGETVSDKVWYFQILRAPVHFIVSYKQIQRFIPSKIIPDTTKAIMAFNYDDGYLPVDEAVLDHTPDPTITTVDSATNVYRGHPGFDTISEKSSARKKDNLQYLDINVDNIKNIAIGEDEEIEIVNGRVIDKSRKTIIQFSDTAAYLPFKAEFDVTIKTGLGNDHKLEWADVFHLALDMDCKYLSDQPTQRWSMSVCAYLEDSYGKRVETNLLENDKSTFQLRNLPSTASYYRINLISTEYYRLTGNEFPLDTSTFWMYKYSDETFKPENNYFDTFSKTRLNQTSINALFPTDSIYEKKLRLTIRIEPEYVASAQFGLSVRIKEICFCEDYNWVKSTEIIEILKDGTAARPELCDGKRSWSPVEYQPEKGKNKIELNFNIAVPVDLNSASSSHLCFDMDVRCFDAGIDENATWKVTCTAQRILKADQKPVAGDLFVNILEINSFLVKPVVDSVYNFIPNAYYGGDEQRNNEKSLWPIGSIGSGTTAQTIAAKEMTLLSKDKMALVKDNELTRTIHVEIKVDKSYQQDQVVLQLREVALIALKETEFSEDEVYVRCNGEYSGKDMTSNSVYGVFYHILNVYDGIAGNVSLGNLDRCRAVDWGRVGRQITEQKNSFDYLKELCQQSFVGMFPSRKGVITLCAWMQQEDRNLPVFNETTIIRDSIKSYVKTKPQDLFNDFFISYAYNPGADSYDKILFVTNAWKTEFPSKLKLEGGVMYEGKGKSTLSANKAVGSDEVTIIINDQNAFWDNINEFQITIGSLVSFEGYDGDNVNSGISFYQGRVTDVQADIKQIKVQALETFYTVVDEEKTVTSGNLVSYRMPWDERFNAKRTWTTFVGGINFTNRENEEIAYQLATTLWNRCRDSFLYTGKLQKAPDSLCVLKWYVDEAVFSGEGIRNGAVNYLHNLIDWTTRPKAQVEFTIPINGDLSFYDKTSERKKNLHLELLDKVIFNDTIFTRGQSRFGWVTKIEPDMKKGVIKIALILEADDYSDLIIERGIPENDDMPWIYENGTRDDIIIET